MLGRGVRSKGERDGEGDSGYTWEEGRERGIGDVVVDIVSSDPVGRMSKSKSKSANELLLPNDERRSSRLPRELPLATSCTSFLHWVKSLIAFSLALNFFSFTRLASTSCKLALVLASSLFRTQDKPVELLSLRIAAV